MNRMPSSSLSIRGKTTSDLNHISKQINNSCDVLSFKEFLYSKCRCSAAKPKERKALQKPKKQLAYLSHSPGYSPAFRNFYFPCHLVFGAFKKWLFMKKVNSSSVLRSLILTAHATEDAAWLDSGCMLTSHPGTFCSLWQSGSAPSKPVPTSVCPHEVLLLKFSKIRPRYNCSVFKIKSKENTIRMILTKAARFTSSVDSAFIYLASVA